jgi:serine/threonine-protein kinase
VTGDPRASRLGELAGGKYKVVRLMAQGGMGVVYEAQHTVVKRRFALKFLRPDLAERRDFLDRFRREAEAAGALESEHVAAAVDFGVAADGAPFIVMEHLVGESLGTLLERETRLPPGRAAELIRQACRGIQAAHAAGIVHRDLKPHNLFVCRRQDGTDLVKVLDFGVAKLQGADQANAATGTGAVMGTAPYMSPEQARGDKVVDSATDVYALGAILYELLSGKRPHPGDSHNAVLHHIGTQPAVPLALAQPGLPDDLVALIERTLSPDPALRPESAEALGAALAAWARREVWPAAPPIDAPAAAPPAALPDSPPSPAAVARRGPLLLGAAAAVALVGIAIGVAQRRTVAPRSDLTRHIPSPPPAPASPPAAISPGPKSSAKEEVAPTNVAELPPPAASRPSKPAGRPGVRPSGRPLARGRPSAGHAAVPAAVPAPTDRPSARPPPLASAATGAEPPPAPPVEPRPEPPQTTAPTFDPENPYYR